MFIYLLIILLLACLLAPHTEKFVHQNETFVDYSSITSGYGYIDDNIAVGNPLSWSDQTNRYVDINSKGKRDPVIAQANGFPLAYEERSTIPVKKSMFFFDNYESRPECCLGAPYSSSKGCVCWTPPPLNNSPVIQANRISPSS
jgi:hypothetical protein